MPTTVVQVAQIWWLARSGHHESPMIGTMKVKKSSTTAKFVECSGKCWEHPYSWLARHGHQILKLGILAWLHEQAKWNVGCLPHGGRENWVAKCNAQEIKCDIIVPHLYNTLESRSKLATQLGEAHAKPPLHLAILSSILSMPGQDLQVSKLRCLGSPAPRVSFSRCPAKGMLWVSCMIADVIWLSSSIQFQGIESN